METSQTSHVPTIINPEKTSETAKHPPTTHDAGPSTTGSPEPPGRQPALKLSKLHEVVQETRRASPPDRFVFEASFPANVVNADGNVNEDAWRTGWEHIARSFRLADERIMFQLSQMPSTPSASPAHVYHNIRPSHGSASPAIPLISPISPLPSSADFSPSMFRSGRREAPAGSNQPEDYDTTLQHRFEYPGDTSAMEDLTAAFGASAPWAGPPGQFAAEPPLPGLYDSPLRSAAHRGVAAGLPTNRHTPSLSYTDQPLRLRPQPPASASSRPLLDDRARDPRDGSVGESEYAFFLRRRAL